jgi:hypothetical protein
MAAMMGSKAMGGAVPPEARGTSAVVPMSAVEHAAHHAGAATPDARGDSAFAKLQARGAAVMGVGQYTSQHAFEDLPDGGRIVLVRDPADSTGTTTIRTHLQALAVAMAAGDFSMSAMVHDMDVPGTKQMASHRSAIRFQFEPLPGGGAVRIVVDHDTVALDAVRQFLSFQRADHRVPD